MQDYFSAIKAFKPYQYEQSLDDGTIDTRGQVLRETRYKNDAGQDVAFGNTQIGEKNYNFINVGSYADGGGSYIYDADGKFVQKEAFKAPGSGWMDFLAPVAIAAAPLALGGFFTGGAAVAGGSASANAAATKAALETAAQSVAMGGASAGTAASAAGTAGAALKTAQGALSVVATAKSVIGGSSGNASGFSMGPISRVQSGGSQNQAPIILASGGGASPIAGHSSKENVAPGVIPVAEKPAWGLIIGAIVLAYGAARFNRKG